MNDLRTLQVDYKNHRHLTVPVCIACQGRDLPTSQLDSFLGECVGSNCRLCCRACVYLHQRNVTVRGRHVTLNWIGCVRAGPRVVHFFITVHGPI